MSDTQNHSARDFGQLAWDAAVVDKVGGSWNQQPGATKDFYRRVGQALYDLGVAAAADAVDAPALAEARQLLAEIAYDAAKHFACYGTPTWVCYYCSRPWPCPVERARRFLTEQETT